MVRCQLDRALANEDRHTLFPYSYTEYLGMVGSDRRPVVAYLEDKVKKRRGQFQFDKRRIGHDGLMEATEIGWGASIGDNIGENLGDVVSKIGELQKVLEEVQTDDNITQEDILDIIRKLQEAYKDEEEY